MRDPSPSEPSGEGATTTEALTRTAERAYPSLGKADTNCPFDKGLELTSIDFASSSSSTSSPSSKPGSCAASVKLADVTNDRRPSTTTHFA